MNLKKTIITAVAVALLIGGNFASASVACAMESQGAEVEHQIITPYWNEINNINVDISSNNTTLYPEVYIKAKKSTNSISGTMYLEKYNSGKWTSVSSWNITGTGDVFLSKSYKGTSGYKYRTRVVVTVNGENAVATSSSCEI